MFGWSTWCICSGWTTYSTDSRISRLNHVCCKILHSVDWSTYITSPGHSVDWSTYRCIFRESVDWTTYQRTRLVELGTQIVPPLTTLVFFLVDNPSPCQYKAVWWPSRQMLLMRSRNIFKHRQTDVFLIQRGARSIVIGSVILMFQLARCYTRKKGCVLFLKKIDACKAFF